MASKTIRTNITMHQPGPQFRPVKFHSSGYYEDPGETDTIEHPPGSLVTLDAAEAESLLQRFGGQEVDPDTGEVIRTVTPSDMS